MVSASSYADQVTDVLTLKWLNYSVKAFRGENLDYKTSIEFGYAKVAEAGTVATFTINLERKFGKDVLETIGPTSLLVLVSWVRN